MAAGASATFTVVEHVNSSTASGTNIVNTATVASPTDSTSPHSATVTTPVVTSAVVGITMIGKHRPVTDGHESPDSSPLPNNGPSDAQSVQLTDAVPANTTFV